MVNPYIQGLESLSSNVGFLKPGKDISLTWSCSESKVSEHRIISYI